MRSILFTTLLALPTVAAAQSLDIDGAACPGPMMINGSGFTPGGSVAVLRGSRPGSDLMPAGPCAGGSTDLGGLSYITTIRADGAGNFSAMPDISGGTCGSLIQMVDASTCELSNTDILAPDVADECGPTLDCACDGAFQQGERVMAAVDSPAGASGIFAGAMGTVTAGTSGGLSLNIQWDGWSSGHTGNCAVAECGDCVESDVDERWWVNCGDVESTGECAGGFADEFDGFDASIWSDLPAGFTYDGRGNLVVEGDGRMMRTIDTYEPTSITGTLNKDESCDDHFVVLSTDPGLLWGWSSVPGAMKFVWNCSSKFIYGQTSSASAPCADSGVYDIDISIAGDRATFSTSPFCDDVVLADPLLSSGPMYMYIGADNDTGPATWDRIELR
jgi:hypothetical protein